VPQRSPIIRACLRRRGRVLLCSLVDCARLPDGAAVLAHPHCSRRHMRLLEPSARPRCHLRSPELMHALCVQVLQLLVSGAFFGRGLEVMGGSRAWMDGRDKGVREKG